MTDIRAAFDHWPSPPPRGWAADDLDHLPAEGPGGEPGFFEHVELIDGALVFTAPQTRFHERVVFGLRVVLNAQVPEDLAAVTQMDVKLGHRMRPCPDVLVVDAAAVEDDERTFYVPTEVRLAVEVVSPESEDRDRKTKPSRYAEAGIAHFWRVENNGGSPVVYVYELDPATGVYALTGIHHDRLTIPVPFPIDIDLTALPR
ncbi:Uma2 family endonuclease [Streptosporangium becharense]|uniref:Uma2 family endonuclease n=1 Tax=Streptosporangium becharense TaxID=1816182 RepID=A0A7W9IGM6_9ACTN|nr:Uma2 family endonuclease [Streptosporangium becharense]MBB2909031.1 Uma2 family endonuclease [Streptosporangium becharense]MBB5819951.1 Uma2 family endonuclease [Streptosporangium becharense]